jgi:hypothetical protein
MGIDKDTAYTRAKLQYESWADDNPPLAKFMHDLECHRDSLEADLQACKDTINEVREVMDEV